MIIHKFIYKIFQGSGENMSFKIREIEIDNPVVLAPMAGVCNAAFRTIIKEMGTGLIYAEMVSDKAVVYQNKKTLDMNLMFLFSNTFIIKNSTDFNNVSITHFD